MSHVHWVGAGADAPSTAEVGGKGRALDELHRLGTRVPAAFVVTADAYRDAVAGDVAAEIRARLASTGAEEESDGIRSLLFEATAGHPAAPAVRAAYRDLGEPPVAVRSSSTAEDSAAHSFAGEHDTYLWVHGADRVDEAVRRCWASLFTARAISYRARASAPPDEDAMAVVVQRMVDADASGVFMTLNPTNGDRSKIVVESVWGLGEPLVSGQVDPDRFVVDKVTGEVLERVVADKATRAVRDPATGHGIATVPVDEADRARPSLTDERLAELVELARLVERHAGRPQDGEFAVDDRHLYLLQARPETVWSARPPRSVSGGGNALTHVIAALTGGGSSG